MKRHFQDIINRMFRFTMLETIKETKDPSVNVHIELDVSMCIDSCCSTLGFLLNEEFIDIPIEHGQGEQTLTLIPGNYHLQTENQAEFEIQMFVNEQECESHCFEVKEEEVLISLCLLPRKENCVCFELLFEKGQMEYICQEEIHFQLIGCNCYEVCLNKENDFCMCINCIDIGEYELCADESLSFFKEGEELGTTLCIDDTRIQIHVVKEMPVVSTLSLEGFIRKNKQELVFPQECDVFSLCIKNDVEQFSVQLDKDNDFFVCEELEKTCYTIENLSNQRVCFSYQRKLYEDCVVVDLCKDACVRVIGDTRTQNCSIHSPLRIQKKVRAIDGSLCRPGSDECFKVMVKRLGYCETFLLNNNNNFTIELLNVCAGWYEVEELCEEEYETSYVVDGNKEKSNACFQVCENKCHEVIIINEQHQKGSVTVCKYIRNACGEFEEPQEEEQFEIILSSYFMKECFILNRENNWCLCFSNLSKGSYEIREKSCNDYKVSYIVDSGKENNCARFIIDGQQERDIKIINETILECAGTLKISLMEETRNQEIVKPAAQDVFEVEVESSWGCERYCLDIENNWCMYLDGLCKDEYCARILNCEGEIISCVNGNYQKEACVCLKEDTQSIRFIRRRCYSGTLILQACLLNCEKEKITIPKGMYFEILVEGKQFSDTFILDECNRYRILLEDLPCENFRIIQKDNLGYQVSYFINKEETDYAQITMREEDQCVTIVNQMICCSKNLIVKASFLNDTCTQNKEDLCFILKGIETSQEFILNEQNEYCMIFDDLTMGCYELITNDSCDIQICIDEKPCEEGKFTLGEEDLRIDLIIEHKQEAFLCISKQVMIDHQLCIPDKNECFDILFTGKGVHEIYHLHAENDFTIQLFNLKNQQYEIKELGDEFCVEYEIDGCIQQEGKFLYEGINKNVVIINHEQPHQTLEIRKYICDDNGRIVLPEHFECFEVLLEGHNYKQSFILNKDNQFMIQLFDLESGCYRIDEITNCNCPEYIIQGVSCDGGEFELGDEDLCIEIINTKCMGGSIHLNAFIEENGTFHTPPKQDEIEVLLTSETICDTIVLKNKNMWSYALCDLCRGMYCLKADGMKFIVDGECFMDGIEIDLDNEDLKIDIIYTQETNIHICVKKVMLDEEGNRRQPDQDHSYNMRLYHNKAYQDFTLDRNNNFSLCFDHQKSGIYELQELNDCEVLYQTNQGDLLTHGRFEVINESVEVCVCNLEESKKELRIYTNMEDGKETYTIQVRGPRLQRQIVLQAQNAYACTLEQLEKGMYEISIQNEEYNQITYKINGINQERGRFLLSKNSEAELCFEKKTNTVLYFEALESENPMPVHIQLNNDKNTKDIILDEWNRYMYTEEVPYGEYSLVTCGEEMMFIDKQEMINETFIADKEQMHIQIQRNHTSCDKGVIEVCKLIKEMDGSYSYPRKNESFSITVIGNNYEESFILNEKNQFYIKIMNLEDGWYEIKEENVDNVNYIINQKEAVNRGLVMVKQNYNSVKIINFSKIEEQGHIRICKFNRMDHNLVIPETGVYQIHISKPGYNEVIELNEENGYCIQLDVEKGMYVIDELNHDGVSYIVDEGNECCYGVVTVMDHHEIKIINELMIPVRGSIHIQKKIRGMNGEFIEIPVEFSAVLHVSKAGFNKKYTLTKENNWEVEINDLEDGIYVLDEISDTNQNVSFISDGQSETRYGVVQINGDMHHVEMINTIETTSSLTITKYIQDETGEHLPSMDDVFQVEIWRDDIQRMVTLSSENNWQVTLHSLENGIYRIIETSQMGYRVQYRIDQRPLNDQAVIRMEGSMHQVDIINTRSSNLAYLRVGKYIVNADGTRIRPAEGDRYTIEIIGMEEHQRIELAYDNHFETVVALRKEGMYRVEEIGAEEFITTYSVNGGIPSSIGDVEVFFQKESSVDILNERSANSNHVQIVKYMLNREGAYIKPQSNQTFSFILKGKNSQINYDLNEKNDWTIDLMNLVPGIYSIEEVTSPYEVKYLVNTPEFSERAVFEVVAGSELIVGIINILPAIDVSSLTIEKVIVQEDGSVQMPQEEETYSVWVSGPGFSDVYTLDYSNQFVYTIQNLAEGIYHVEELQNQTNTITYVVDGKNPAVVGEVQIMDNRNHKVQIQNHEEIKTMKQENKQKQSLKFVI